MKASTSPSPKEKSASQQIDAILKEPGDWRGKKLSQLRALIKKADPAMVEEVKWKKPSRPSGVPVWSRRAREESGELRTDLATGPLPRRDRRSGRGVPALAAQNKCFVLGR